MSRAYRVDARLDEGVIVIRRSAGVFLVMLAASGSFVAAGVCILLADPRQGPMAWGCISFFGGCALVSLWQLLDARPRLVVDEDGIYDRTLHVGRIGWGDIKGAYLKSIQDHDFICLVLFDDEEYVRRLPPLLRSMVQLNESLGFTPISINLTGIHGQTEQLLELILKRCQESEIERFQS
jgi:hypothetical protein